MPRYVLLRHECPDDYRDGPHWDLMLEFGAALRTWSLQELPAAWRDDGQGDNSVTAMELADHRLAYLDYEGEVSNGRGEVQRCSEGEFEFEEHSFDSIAILASSGQLHGRLRLCRDKGAVWRLTYLPSPTR